MNWLTNWVRPKLRELVGKPREVSESLWHKCPACNTMLFHRELTRTLHVCRHCGHHLRLTTHQRLKMLFDNGQYKRYELPENKDDPLNFKDRKRYGERLKEARSNTDEADAIIVAGGQLGGAPVVIAAFNFDFLGGSMGMAVGNGVVEAAAHAVKLAAPLIIIPASGGARMQEGILSLMQMARTTIAVGQVRDAGLPYVVILSDPTTGGVSASFAMLGDIAIAEPGALIGFAGQRVIEQTIREQLPEGFQRAEYLQEHGMVDIVVHRSELKDTVARIIDLLQRPFVASSSSTADCKPTQDTAQDKKPA